MPTAMRRIAIYRSSLEAVRFAPIYDAVSTRASLSSSGAPDLSVHVRKAWAPGKALARFFPC